MSSVECLFFISPLSPSPWVVPRSWIVGRPLPLIAYVLGHVGGPDQSHVVLEAPFTGAQSRSDQGSRVVDRNRRGRVERSSGRFGFLAGVVVDEGVSRILQRLLSSRLVSQDDSGLLQSRLRLPLSLQNAVLFGAKAAELIRLPPPTL